MALQEPTTSDERTSMRNNPLVAAGVCIAIVWLGGFALYLKFSPIMTAVSPAATHSAGAHSHVSLHGGMVESVGNNHVEAVFDTQGGIRVYVLGTDETQMYPIAAPALQGEIQPQGSQAVTPLLLPASPQYGEGIGRASQFTGKLPMEMRGRLLSLTLNVPLDGKLYRVRLDAGGHGGEPAMPNNAADRSPEAERKLFLTPGGLYTPADIVANGNTVPSIKYADFVATHNMNPNKGDRVCPITNTLANPRLSWVVGGKSYTFCCPPCLREFVLRAKTSPKTIKPPDAYVKQ